MMVLLHEGVVLLTPAAVARTLELTPRREGGRAVMPDWALAVVSEACSCAGFAVGRR